MALIKCPECGKEISDNADNCPNCGYPIKKRKVSINKWTILAIVVIISIIIGVVVIVKSNRLTDEERIEVKNVISVISEIGEVKKNSEKVITEAEAEYNKLSDKCKRHVKNYDVLKTARKDYDKLMAEETIELISEIGTIDENSDGAIDKAQKAYDSLTDEQKKLVTNADTIEKAVSELEKKRIENVEAEISAIGNVSLESKDAISNARKSYDSLEETTKDKISNIDLLENAEKEYEQIAIQACIKEISEIGEVTLDSKDKIDSAKKIYDSLDSSKREQVSNYDDLKNAEEKYKALKEEERIKQNTITAGDTFDNQKWEVTYKGADITDKILPNNTGGYYLYYYADDDETFIDLKFTVKNIDSGILGMDGIVSNCKVEYQGNSLDKQCKLYYSTGSRIEQVYSWDGLDALDSCTLHAVIDMPRELKTNDEPVRVFLNIADKEKIINVRGYDSVKVDKASEDTVAETEDSQITDKEVKDNDDNKAADDANKAKAVDNSASAEWLVGTWQRSDNSACYTVSADGSVTIDSSIVRPGSGIQISGNKAICTCDWEEPSSLGGDPTHLRMVFSFSKQSDTTAILTYTTSVPDTPEVSPRSDTITVTKR